MSSCQALADELGTFVPLIEPTCIDELRIDYGKLKQLREGDLRDKILPPLSQRWPIGRGERSERYLSYEVDGLFSVDSDRFADLEFQEEKALYTLQDALKELGGEIRRQIRVRDHVLAEQSDIILAYRPFSLPDSPEATGGVQEEISTVIRKKAFEASFSSPGVILIHPEEDEKQRRRNLLIQIWDYLVNEYLDSSSDKLLQLQEFCLPLIEGAPSDASREDREELASKLIAKIKELNISGKVEGTGTMVDGYPRIALESMQRFAEKLLNTTLLYLAFDIKAKDFKKNYKEGLIYRHNDLNNLDDVFCIVRKLNEGGDKNG